MLQKILENRRLILRYCILCIVLVIFDIMLTILYNFDIAYIGILDVDCKCFDTFISSLLVVTAGSKRRRDMGKRPRWRIHCFRKFCIHSML